MIEVHSQLERSIGNALESAVLQDLRVEAGEGFMPYRRFELGTAGPRGAGARKALWDQRWGGFSGWFGVGPLSGFLADQDKSPALNARVVGRLAAEGLRPGQDLVYRLVNLDPAVAGKKLLYIGSAVRGTLAQRLRAHVQGKRSGSRSLHEFLEDLPSLAKIRVDVGWIQGQKVHRDKWRSAINYNAVFILEKILQRRERPKFWNPRDRTFE